MAKKTSISDAEKLEAVLLLLRKQEPAAALARRYGVSDPTLYRWRDEFLEGGKAALANGTGIAGILRILRIIIPIVTIALIGAVLGVVFFGASLTLITKDVVTGLFAGVVLTLLAFGAVAYLLYRLWTMHLVKSARELLQQFLKDLRIKKPDLPHDDIRASIMDLFRTLAAYLGFAAAIGLVVALITNLTLVATLVVNRLQADRLAEQNELLQSTSDAAVEVSRHQTALLEKQNRLLLSSNEMSAFTRASQAQQEAAQRRYDEILRLLDSANSIEAQKFGVSLIPDAMVMAVEMIQVEDGKPIPDESDPIQRVIIRTYPNFEPLKQRLLAYTREDRITTELRRRGYVADGKDPDEVEASKRNEVLQALGPLSNEILDTYHRLGICTDDPKNAECKWIVAPKNPQPTDVSLKVRPAVIWSGHPAANLARTDCLDLGHLKDDELVGAELPVASFKRPHLLPRGFNLRSANFPGAYMVAAQLQGASLTSAQLSGANLVEAKFQGAVFPCAEFKGADLEQAQFHAAGGGDAQLQGANLTDARLQLVGLGGAQLQGATLCGTHLEGAHLRGSDLQGAILTSTHLQCANLLEAMFQGARICEAHFQGAILSNAQFTGARIRLARSHGVHRHYKEKRAWYEANRYGEEYEIEPAMIQNARFGSTKLYGFEKPQFEQLLELKHKWHLDDDEVLSLRWSNRDDAIADLEDVLPNAGALLKEFDSGPTEFGTGNWKANFDGVYIDEESLENLRQAQPDVDIDALFPNRITDKTVLPPGDKRLSWQQRLEWKFPGQPLPKQPPAEKNAEPTTPAQQSLP